MATQQLLASLILISFLSFSSPLPLQNILNASPILTDSGHQAMELTLEFVHPTLPILKSSPYLTVFAPSDSAFIYSGQPNMSTLLNHFSPLFLPLHSLKSLPPGTKIPSLSNSSLTVTSSPSDGGDFSLNGVKITGSAIYSDGLLVVYGVEGFIPLDEANSTWNSTLWRSTHNLGCSVMEGGGKDYSFEAAVRVLESKGYDFMASFLHLQLAEFNDRTMFTVFAPDDKAVNGVLGNFSGFWSIFLRHVVPCRILWSDLVDLGDGVMLPTYLKDFTIRTSKDGGTLTLNGVQVSAPAMYSNSWLVVHGINGTFVEKQRPGKGQDAWYGWISTAEKVNVEYHVMRILIGICFLILDHLVRH
ncbi:hypothetical protein Tsubulata_035772 [Turnera subulata]|uniref:FAS1 domain-containing protein n=1 Tax=Turnera subulata TaxID=218843 RepID=A0A9Q0FZ69_9ROSI|nr:hypothetical protein Tsubulata_035772 [Turnera subulata]